MSAHPLAIELIDRLQDKDRARVVDLGSGRGRNAQALVEAGFEVVTISDEDASGRDALGALAGSFDAVIATHALLHGTPQSVAERIDAAAHVLCEGGLLHATFASVRDARYGKGARLADATFAPRDGDERGVPHVYYNEARLRAIITPYFTIESLEERDADRVAGTWAHPNTPLRGAVHWLLRAIKAER